MSEPSQSAPPQAGGATIHHGGVASAPPPSSPASPAAGAQAGVAASTAAGKPALAHGTAVEHSSTGKGTYLGLARDAKTGLFDENTGLILPDGVTDTSAARRVPLAEIKAVQSENAKPAVDPRKPESNAPATAEQPKQ